MNRFNPNIHRRRNIRLKGYDYSQAGLYFLTICCRNKVRYLGNIENREMVLNDSGNTFAPMKKQNIMETPWANTQVRPYELLCNGSKQ